MSASAAPLAFSVALIASCLSGCGASDEPALAAGGTGGAAGAGGQPADCADYVIVPGLLDEPERWHWVSAALPNALFASPLGLHLAWVAYRFYPEGKVGPYTSDAVATLVISTLQGDTLSHQTYPLLPDGTLFPTGTVRSVAARPDGTVAVGYSWNDEKLQDQPHVALLRVGDSEPYAKLPIPVDDAPTQLGSQTAAGWDGEAFAMHAYGALPQFTLHVARVDDTGTVLLPFTRYGVTPNVGYGPFGHKTSTDATTGRSYVFDDGYFPLLSGHLRDGTPLPGTEGGPKTVSAKDVPVTSTTALALDANEDGAWVAWSLNPGGKAMLVVQRLDIEGTPSGYPALPSVFPAPGDSIHTVSLRAHGTGVTVFGASWRSIYRYDYDDGVLSGPTPVVVGQEKDDLHPRQVAAVDWNGTTWLAYQHAAKGIHLRLLKAAPGCTYPATVPGLPDGS